MKQTAVEWLENEFQEMCKDFGGLHTDFIERFKQAKAMEKEQIIDAYLKLMCDEYGYEVAPQGWIDNAEQYYNSTFKSE